MSGEFSLEIVNCAIRRVAIALPARVTEKLQWESFSEEDLWRELVACILGSAVSFVCALRALQQLTEHELLVIPPPFDLENSLHAVLVDAGYRFPRTRATHIAVTASRIFGSQRTISFLLRSISSSDEARRLLISICLGIGPKQASMFLRNIGFSDHAVLDRHLLRYMGLKGTSLKTSVSSLEQYERLEGEVRRSAEELELTVHQLDWAAWITMRTISGKESKVS